MSRVCGPWVMVAMTIIASGSITEEAHALFLVEVTATLNSPNPSATTVGGSTVTLSPFADTPGDADLGTIVTPIHETYGSTSVSSTNTATSDPFSLSYDWALTFSHVVNGVVTGATASLEVTGTLSGVVSAFGSTLANTFTGGPSSAGTQLTIDGQQITVQLDPYTPPGTPPATSKDFSVAISNQGPTTPSGGIPEPTTMALMGVGGLVLLAPYLRRKARMAGGLR